MYQQYSGLTNHEVIENRRKYGENDIQPPSPWSLKDRCVHVFTLRLFRVFLTINLLIAIILAFLDALHMDFYDSLWKILFISIIFTLYIYAIAWMVGQWNKRKKRLELNALISLLLVTLYLICLYACHQDITNEEGIRAYAESIGLSLAIFCITAMTCWLERKNRKTFHTFHQIHDEVLVKVIRDGGLQYIPRKEIVLGDLILLKAGDEVPADAKLIESSNLVVDESSLSGTAQCNKSSDFFRIDEHATFLSTEIFKGCRIVKGEAVARVFGVGAETMSDRSYLTLFAEQKDVPPLQKQLNRLAKLITKIDYIGAIIIFLGSMIYFSAFSFPMALILAATFLIFAIPEGLGMAVAFSLAFTTHRMRRSNTIPRTMHACETIGSTTIICIDTIALEDIKYMEECMRAGIKVMVITSEPSYKAKELAIRVGLWDVKKDDDQSILVGMYTENMSNFEIMDRLKDAKIVSRARPTDKAKIIRLLKQMGHVVTVVGYGNNDAAALNAADVGVCFANSTTIAKETCDFIITDNKLSNLSKAIMWGRALHRNIQRFILFQLIINFVACGIFIINILTNQNPILTISQMLWINICMGTLAAMALSALPASQRTMRDKPRKIKESLLYSPLVKRILSTSGAMLIGLIGLYIFFLFADVQSFIHINQVGILDQISAYEKALFFVIFAMLQCWNLFNVRAFKTQQSVFHSLSWEKSRWFILIAFVLFISLLIIVQAPGLQTFFSIPKGGLCWQDWLIIFVSTSIVLWIGELIRFSRSKRRRVVLGTW